MPVSIVAPAIPVLNHFDNDLNQVIEKLLKALKAAHGGEWIVNGDQHSDFLIFRMVAA